MKSIFVTGTDTGVGKTLVCAGLLKSVYGADKVAYWKPVQTGTIVGDDTKEMRALTDIKDEDTFMDPAYRFTDPMAPHLAAEKWGKRIDLTEMAKQFEAKRKQGYSVIVEGPGGLMLPLNDKELLADFIKMIKLPLLLVGSDHTGVVNQVLLTARVAKEMGIPILGVVLLEARGQLSNAPAINSFTSGGVKVICEVPPSPDKKSLVARIGADPAIRALSCQPSIPA